MNHGGDSNRVVDLVVGQAAFKDDMLVALDARFAAVDSRNRETEEFEVDRTGKERLADEEAGDPSRLRVA